MKRGQRTIFGKFIDFDLLDQMCNFENVNLFLKSRVISHNKPSGVLVLVLSLLSSVSLNIWLKHPISLQMLHSDVIICFLCFLVTARSNVPVTLLEVVPATAIGPLELPLPAAEHNGHCQDSCGHETYTFPLFDPGDIRHPNTQLLLDSPHKMSWPSVQDLVTSSGEN